MIVLAMLCTVLAVTWLAPGPGLERLAVRAGHRPQTGRRLVLVVVGACAGSTVLVLAAPAGRWRTLVVVGLLGAGYGVAFGRRWWRGRVADRRRDDVARACWELAGEVAAGRVASTALAVVAADVPLVAPVASTARLGGDVATAWRAQAVLPGADGLLMLARAWEVCARTGAPLGPALRRVAEATRERRRLVHTVDGELAAARTSTRLLAGLPVAGLGMGFALGGDPAAFLLDTLPGQACLVLAVALAGAGLLWGERLADGVVVS